MVDAGACGESEGSQRTGAQSEAKGGWENPFEPRSREIIGVRKAPVFGEGCECWRVGGEGGSLIC